MSGSPGSVRRAALAALLVLAAAGRAAAAEGLLFEREYFLLQADRRPLFLAHGGIDPASLVLRVGGARWQADRDFGLRARSGQIVPLRDWSGGGTVIATVEYRFQPGLVESRVAMRPLVPPPAARDGAAARPAFTPDAWDLDQSGNLDVRGSKAVYVSSGTRRELTVDQNLRLNVSGQLTPGIFVRAALTDDNLPVVPEGNTEELQDIDKVLVELEARDWRTTLGDFVAERRGTRFGDYRRKLQGFALDAHPGRLRAEALFGSPKGRYRTVELQGEEANQGPYFLGTGEAGQNLFVVAGTERVTFDGEVLTRGADRDYTIDYVRGTITFTFRRLVTAETLIVVEFEEGEGEYGRGVVGGGGGAGFAVGGAPVAIGVRLARERDDEGRLRSGELSPEDEAILAAAGDDPLAAVAPGASEVEPGTGDYDRIDDGTSVYFVYASEGGDWDVQFFHAGAGLGDYDLTELTETGVRVYAWVGAGLGAYRVGRLLPLPESQSVASFTADVGDSAGAGLHAEWNVSDRDRNTLSGLDGGDDSGRAVHAAARSGDVALLGGTFAATASWDDRDDRFAPFLVSKTIHDFEGWGLGERARRAGFLDQADRELSGKAGWRIGDHGKRLAISAGAGTLAHGPAVNADRWALDGEWEWRGGRGRHLWRGARSDDEVDPLDVRRFDQGQELRWQTGPVVPRVAFSRETWRDDAVAGAAARGWRLDKLTGGLGSPAGGAWRWDLAFTRGLADSLRAETWWIERDSRTWQGNLATPRFAGLRVVADATVREVRRPGGQDETTRLGRLELGATWPRLGTDWNLGYGVDNSRTEVLDRQLVYVGLNEGRYDENGIFVGEGRGDFELLLAGTDSLVATTAVKSDFSWRQDFAWLGKDRLWGAWNSQTRVGVEARSLTDDIRGLLRLDRDVIFAEESVVLARVDLSQEVALLRHLRAWDLRWRFDFTEAKDRQYAQGREDRLRRDHTVTLIWNPAALVSVRLRGEVDRDRRETAAQLNPSQLGFDVEARRLEAEGSWRPVTGSRVAISVERITRDDAMSGVSQTELAGKPSARWRLGRAWSAEADVRLASVQSDEPPGSRRPYSFPLPGANVETSARLAWDPNRFLNFALAWFGRKSGGREWQHDLRLESTARF
ncbi:MAG TPA: hypothetical protein PLL30_06680 [Candidatus Krumholzibacteria bacterium]|nr:hypothetical protein [Candidatus Krumholzibacteria bacterium]HPD71447.1 hypothetical protein [Candidatus Krumholzibacteria bacterium]HRY41620.1 hypothetical protein [Candidatus Krumholzibacteria bacterium]